MPINLTQRLLCAARQAYQIGGGGAVGQYQDPPPPVGVSETALIAYEVAPVGYLADQQHVDAAFAAVIPEGILISVRGTLPPETALESPQQALAVLYDWAKNAHAQLTSTQNQTIKFPGKVHPEFYLTFRNLWNGPNMLGAKVLGLLQQHPDKKRVIITGHSKGGAVAPFIAYHLHELFMASPALYAAHTISVRTFAPARMGDDAFAFAYNNAVGDHVRYEYDDDIVPHLPIRTDLLDDAGVDLLLSLAIATADPGYGDVGTLRYIEQNGAYSNKSDDVRIAEIAQRLRPENILQPGGVRYVLKCHGINKHSGYANAPYAPPID